MKFDERIFCDFEKVLSNQSGTNTDSLEKIMRNKLKPMFDLLENKYQQQIFSPSKFDQYIKSPQPYIISRKYLQIDELIDPMFDIIYRSYQQSSKLGLNKLMLDYGVKIDGGVDISERTEMYNMTYNLMTDIKNSYKKLTREVLSTARKKNLDYGGFKRELMEHPMFKNVFNKAESGSDFESNRVYVPEYPHKATMLGNVVAQVAKFWNNARNKVMNSLGGKVSYVYVTQQDERVSSICKPWHGRTSNYQGTLGIIPQHINCRCVWEHT